jgi:quinolinate synthase
MDARLDLFAAGNAAASLPQGEELISEIKRLKKERNAVILAHYYQSGDIQDIADFVGDSLDLSRKAAATDAEVIAFCGVKFMAEVAKILSPNKTVVLPDLKAGCSLEDSCPPDKFAAFRAAHPDHVSLTYINCSAAVKAHSDIIVTSSSAEHIISQIPADKKILFAPDRHLGAYLAKKTGRDMLLWDGTCIVHEAFSEKELLKLKAEHPDAPVAAHPECPAAILDHADYVGATSGILKYAIASPAKTLLIATEPNIIHQMRLAAPDKEFIGVPGADGNCSCNTCPFMALNSMQKLYLCLRDLKPVIDVPEEVRLRALVSLQRMLDMAPKTGASHDISKVAPPTLSFQGPVSGD